MVTFQIIIGLDLGSKLFDEWLSDWNISAQINHWLYETVYVVLQTKRYIDVIMSTMASQITSVSIVCSPVCSGADWRKYQSSTSLAFVRGIHWSPVNSQHKGPVTQKMFPFDDVIMEIIFPSIVLHQSPLVANEANLFVYRTKHLCWRPSH